MDVVGRKVDSFSPGLITGFKFFSVKHYWIVFSVRKHWLYFGVNFLYYLLMKRIDLCSIDLRVILIHKLEANPMIMTTFSKLFTRMESMNSEAVTVAC